MLGSDLCKDFVFLCAKSFQIPVFQVIQTSSLNEDIQTICFKMCLSFINNPYQIAKLQITHIIIIRKFKVLVIHLTVLVVFFH